MTEDIFLISPKSPLHKSRVEIPIQQILHHKMGKITLFEGQVSCSTETARSHMLFESSPPGFTLSAKSQVFTHIGWMEQIIELQRTEDKKSQLHKGTSTSYPPGKTKVIHHTNYKLPTQKEN